MSDGEATEGGSDSGQVLILAGLGLTVLFGVVAVTAGSSGPSDRVEVRSTIVGGDRFGNLSENATNRLRPAFENGTDAGTVTGASYRTTFPTFPAISEFDSGISYYVEYNGRFYGVRPDEATGNEYRVEVTEATNRVRVVYADLPAETRDVIDRAATQDWPINFSEMPPIYQSDGLSSSLLGSQRLYYLSWNGTYYTVATYEPIEFVNGPSGGQILGAVGAAAGLIIALVGVGMRLRES